MWPFVVVEPEIAVEAVRGVSDRLVVVQLHLLPVDRAPQALENDGVEGPPTPLPTALDARLFQPPGSGGARELNALISIEDARLAVP